MWEKPDLGPSFLRAEDMLKDGVWKEVTLTIKEAHGPGTVKAKDKTTIEHPVLDFEKTEKRLVLGKVNQRLIKCATGVSNGEDLVGKKVTIYPVVGDWFGQKDVTSIRVRVPQGKKRPFIQPKNLGKDITGQKQ